MNKSHLNIVKQLLLFINIFFCSNSFAQKGNINLNWSQNTKEIPHFDQSSIRIIEDVKIPYFVKTFELTKAHSSFNISNIKYEAINNQNLEAIIQRNFSKIKRLKKNKVFERKKTKIQVEVFPYAIINDSLKRITSFDYNFTEYGEAMSSPYNNSIKKRWASNSVLSSGEWYKLKITETGVYKLSASFLEDIGMNLKNMDPKTIKIYGNHGYMLPEKNGDFRYDDLQENAILVSGESDGVFNADDYILFYGEGPNKIEYDENGDYPFHKNHLYTTEVFYFITFGGVAGKRISTIQPNESLNEEITFASYDFYDIHEVNKTNHIKSGRAWYGEVFDAQTIYEFDKNYNNLVTTSPLSFTMNAVQKNTALSNIRVSINGSNITNYVMSPGGTNGETSPQRSFDNHTTINFSSNTGKLNIEFEYRKTSSASIAWLDYFGIRGKRFLNLNSEQTIFNNYESVKHNILKYSFTKSNNVVIWDITNPFEVKIQNSTNQGGKEVFKVSNNKVLKKYISYDGKFLNATFVEKVENQNLHATPAQQYLIITNKLFKEDANRLIQYRKDRGMTGSVVFVDEIFNEYGSGVWDVIAIRDFIKSVYDKATGPSNLLQNVLMFGDASYDYKDIHANNTNLVPTYESIESYFPTSSYCSDDFYTFMDSSEGNWVNTNYLHKMDLNIGRIPINTVEDAKAMVDKIIHYESTKTFGPWRNTVVFAADDVGESWDITHLEDADSFSNILNRLDKNYNSQKIFMDAYEQKSVGNAHRYPDATGDFNKYMNKGALIMNYTGHGGEQGLAEERLLDIATIKDWDNMDNMPVFVTATCEFSRFDDPERISAGELCILNHNGGMIGMLTTVRVVYVDPNFYLSLRLWNNYMINESNGTSYLGDIYRLTKNSGSSENDRNFSLLGDPALTLAYPKHEVITDSINFKPVTSFNDTIKALDLITVAGHISDKSGNYLSNFNGSVYPVVYDKAKKQQTLLNDPNSQLREFEVRNDIIFNGSVKVDNGYFQFSFVVPKDINYQYGIGKISYYAHNNIEDAHGHFEDFIIGGSNPNAPEDTEAPKVNVWMDDFSFVFGGNTSNTPLLLAEGEDNSGINTSTSGIGREIIAILDKGTEEEQLFVLNEFYETYPNTYKKGVVRYQLPELSDGKHTAHVKFWDTYNNSAEGYTEFFVNKEDKTAIKEVYTHPNPFYNTTNFRVDHNQAGKDLNVTIKIFDINGKVLLNREKEFLNAPSVIESKNWEEMEDLSTVLSPGIYFYSITIVNKQSGAAKKNGKIICIN